MPCPYIFVQQGALREGLLVPLLPAGETVWEAAIWCDLRGSGGRGAEGHLYLGSPGHSEGGMQQAVSVLGLGVSRARACATTGSEFHPFLLSL